MALITITGIACHGCVLFGDNIPVDDFEEGCDVIWATVLVVEVVGVLPDVESEDRWATTCVCKFTHEWVVLVWGGADSN